jgi:diamine N-acetyltransferase
MTDNGPGVVRVRAARPDELEALLGIQQAASVAGFGHIFPPTRYPFPAGPVRERWRAALGTAEVCVLVAERDGLPVGVAEVAPEGLDGLFVLPCAWGSGVADRLHDAAVQTLHGWGCDCCRLSVLEENHRARRFYERRGWRLDGRRTAPRSRPTRRWSAIPLGWAQPRQRGRGLGRPRLLLLRFRTPTGRCAAGTSKRTFRNVSSGRLLDCVEADDRARLGSVGDRHWVRSPAHR